MTLDLLSRTKAMECLGFTQQDLGYGMSWIYLAGLRLRNVIGFTQQD